MMGGGARYEFDAELWRWESRTDEWVFVRLPLDASDEIADVPRLRAGFGAVKVRVTLGGSRWTTSVFPEAARAAPTCSPSRRRSGRRRAWAWATWCAWRWRPSSDVPSDVPVAQVRLSRASG